MSDVPTKNNESWRQASGYDVTAPLSDESASIMPTASQPVARDTVNHPTHYTFGSIEVIDAIEDWRLGFHLGNVVKYVARSGHKGSELEDLKKAEWYLRRKIESLEKS